MLELRHQAGLTQRLVRMAALTLFAVYLVWNLLWLVKGRLPPSMLLAFSGLPCPTTGAYRSLELLVRGDWRGSLLFNPLTAVYLALAGWSAGVLSVQALQRRRLVLSSLVGKMWFVALATGWAAKFTLGPKYW